MAQASAQVHRNPKQTFNVRRCPFVDRILILLLTSILLLRDCRPSAQDIFLNFTRCCLWQFRNKGESMRRLEVREIRARKLAQLIFGNLGAGLQDYECVRRLAPTLVWHTYDRNLLHGWMSQQNSFDLHGRNVFAAADNYILNPIPDLRVAVCAYDSGIARMEPAIAHCFIRGLGILEVTLHHVIATNDNFTLGFTVMWHFATVFIHHAQLAGG